MVWNLTFIDVMWMRRVGMTPKIFWQPFCAPRFSRKKDQFAHNIERVHRGNYKNPNSPIYAKFLSWKVAQGVLKPTGRVSAPYSPVKSTLKKCNIEWTHYFWKKKGIQRRSVQKNREELHYVSGSIDGEKANIDEKD